MTDFKICYWDSDTQTQAERDANEEEIQEILARQAAALLNVPVGPDAPDTPEVPVAVTMLQARLALLQAGHLENVNAYIAQLPGDAGKAARTYWEFAARVLRADPLVAKLAIYLNLSEIALDQLFISAASF